MSRNTMILLVILAALVTRTGAIASATIEIDRYGPGDGALMPPAGVIVVDVLVDVTDGDSWTAAGITADTFGGAVFRYAFDPNGDPTWPVLISPGTADRFVTFFSEPRNRDGNAWFSNGGAAIAAPLCSSGPTASAYSTHLDVAFFASPPESIHSPTVDGAIMRIALDVSRVCDGETARIFRPNEVPPGYFPIFLALCQRYNNLGTVIATFDNSHITGFSWGLYVSHDFEPCIGDLNCDGRVSLPDLALVLSVFGACPPYSPPAEDFDGDGCVDLQDLLTVLALFDSDCP